MKLFAVVILMIVLSACGQNLLSTTTPSLNFDKLPSFESGKRPCDPAKDIYPEIQWSDPNISLNGYSDPKLIKHYICAKASHNWTFDAAGTKKDIEATIKSIADAKAATARRKELVRVMASRVVSEKEMSDFIGFGTGVFDEPFNVCGSANSCTFSGDYDTMEDAHELYLSRKYNDLIAQQFKLRAIAAEHHQSKPWQEACAEARELHPDFKGCSPSLTVTPLNHGPWKCTLGIDGSRYCTRWQDAGDGCNTCTVGEDGIPAMCTSLACAKPSETSPIDPDCQPKKGETIECKEKP